MASSSSSPCAACKFLRRKCTAECVFAPYFPPDQPHKFANVHKIFGASNITKLLNELPPHQREDAVNSLAYEAEARMKDPVYGCVGAISILQRQMQHLQRELAAAHADLARYTGATSGAVSNPGGLLQAQQTNTLGQHMGMGMGIGMGMGMAGMGSMGMGMGMAAASPHHHHSMQVSREQQVLEPTTHLTREQLVELARVGGGSYEAGLAAALGITTSNVGVGATEASPIGGPAYNSFPRVGSEGASRSSGGSLGQMSPP